MIRKTFRMSVDKSKFDECQSRHTPVWPEMEQTLKEHGAHNYSIHLDEVDGSLFAYVEVDSEQQWDAIADTEVCKRWWKYMRDIMPSNADNSPISVELREVFHLE